MKTNFVSILSLLCLLFCFNNLFAQNNDFDTFLETGKNLWAAPSDWQSSDWQILAGVTTLSGAAFLIDQDVKLFVQNNKNPFFDALFSIDDAFIQTLSAATLFTYVYGIIADNQSMQSTGLDMAEAVLYSTIINRVMKISFGRARPYLTNNQYVFDPPSFSPDYSAFPSGHTTFAFSISTVLASQYDNIIWKTGWYTTAVVVGLARIYNNKHWLSDVIMGAAVGYFLGSFVLEKNNNQVTEPLPQNRPFLSLKIAL